MQLKSINPTNPKNYHRTKSIMISKKLIANSICKILIFRSYKFEAPSLHFANHTLTTYRFNNKMRYAHGRSQRPFCQSKDRDFLYNFCKFLKFTPPKIIEIALLPCPAPLTNLCLSRILPTQILCLD